MYAIVFFPFLTEKIGSLCITLSDFLLFGKEFVNWLEPRMILCHLSEFQVVIN